MPINKPVIFISHAATDAPIARILKNEIERIFANGVEVFASSIPGVIKPGEDWLDSIKSNLEQAQAVIVILTPVSLNRPWIWFETGASWARMSEKQSRIYPLCAQEVNKSEIPAPLNSLQALSLGKADEIKIFFQTLCDQFGFGNMKGFKAATIKTLMPKYNTLKVQESDIRSGTLYDGPYEGYSDEELMEIISDEFVRPAISNSFGEIRKGELIHFAKVDRKLRLPPGTTKKFLLDVVSRYKRTTHSSNGSTDYIFAPYQLFENSLRFGTRKATSDESKKRREL